MVCKRVIYTGRVQGVGFRYTARQIAAGFPVAGYVRNLSDGNVELVAQGEAGAVAGFLAAVALRLRGNIRGADVRDEVPSDHAGFDVRP